MTYTLTATFQPGIVELLSPPQSKASKILADTASRHGMSVDAMKGYSREARFAKARWEVMVALRDEGFSMPRIGRILNRDHTTVLHGLRKMGRA